jgi:hypothetical protein
VAKGTRPGWEQILESGDPREKRVFLLEPLQYSPDGRWGGLLGRQQRKERRRKKSSGLVVDINGDNVA